MSVQTTISKFGGKLIPTSKTVIQASFTGIGFEAGMRAIDNLIGSPMQRSLTFQIPILGSIGIIDVFNYMVHSGGFKFSKKGIFAVGASKFVSGVLPNIGPIQLPMSGTAASAIGSNTSSGGPI